MNSKKHILSRKVIATLLTMAMLVTLFPASMFAGEPGSATTENSVTATENGVTVNKYVSEDGKGDYNLTLEAYASNQLTTTTTTTPLDITLVLDVSGSMDDHFIDGYTEYTPVYELDQSESYFVKIGDSYRSVSYYEGGRFVQKGWSYWQGWKQYVVQPMTSAEDFEQSHIQFYEATYVQGQSKMDALKSAVNTFINQVNEKNTTISDNSQKHRISLVKFADNSYANSIGNDKISDYSDYNFTQVVSDFSTNASDLTSKVTALDAGGATAAEYGLTLAQEVINGQSNYVSNLQGARENAKKIVIFFTDGSPNHSNGFSESVANSAIGKAKELKDNNVDVYSVGVFEDVNSVINGYMNGISSNYPNATAYDSLGDPAADKYYSTADSPDALLKVFEGIAEEITTGTLTANPDSTAVLSDTLSQYFNLPDNFSDTDVTVKYAPATDYDPETKTFTFGEVQDLPGSVSLSVNVDNENETITVSGFDYKTNAASYDTETRDVSGGKLVVTFPIEVDENACLTDGTSDGWYPTNDTTNSRAKLSYKSDAEAGSNDTVTVLDQSPKVQLTNLDANGTDVTVQVYVDGEKVSDPDKYVTFTRDTKDTTYDYFNLVSNTDGVLTYDFNYDPGEGGHDCVDIKVTLNDGTSYILQGVESYQAHGKSGTDNVRSNNNGTYTIDNVTSDATGKVDCTIYLQTQYSVDYYQDETLLMGNGYDDPNVYIAGEDVTSTTAEGPAEEKSTWMNWKNSGYKTTIALPNLPTVEGNVVVDGWFLGSAGGSKQDPSSDVKVSQVKTSADSNRIIKFYATTTAQHTITIKYEDEKGEPLDNAYNDTQNAGYEYSFDVSADKTGEIPFIIEKEGTQYVFDHFTQDSDALSGTLNDNVEITAVYLIDEDKNDVPDKYDATVTYKVENGTWSDGTVTDKTEQFELKTFDPGTNAWVDASLTLGETIPTGMKPNADYVAEGATWDSDINANTAVTGSVVYTYKFTKAKAPALTVEKTVLSVGGESVADQDSIPHAQVGDAIVYQIEVKNTGNVKLESINVTDTMQIPGDDGSLIGKNESVKLYSDVNCEEEFSSTFDLEPDATRTLYAKYEVVQEDAGKQLTNSATAISGTTSGTDIAPSVDVDAMYQLIYDGNAQQGGTVAGTPSSTSHHAGEVSLSTDKPTHSKVNGTDVVFIGWSLTQTNEIYESGENYGTTVDKVTFVDKNITVYAVWGYDTNGDGIADATQVMIQPAAMTIYTGGDGYLGTVEDNNGSTIGAEQSGLPEPGFYFTLPYDLDQKVKAEEDSEDAVDLTNYLTLNGSTSASDSRSWTVKLYDAKEGHNSTAYGKYVYSFVVPKEQDPVRLQFEDEKGNLVTSDEFEIDQVLYQTYTMNIYKGNVEQSTVQATITVGDENYTASVGTVDNTLTIRGVTDEGTSTGIVDNVSGAVDTITASTEGGKVPTYYINGSQIQVTNQDAVQLLVDSIVDSELNDGSTVYDTLLEMAKDELPSSYDGVEFKYLDLVDSSNGNVWVTMGDNDSLTVYWPYPAGTDQDDDFTIIHYEGMDRDFDMSDLEGQADKIQKITPEKTAQGLKFEVSSFSPFALVYDKQTSGGGGGGTTPNPPDLNTEDHFSYVVGYEDGMVKPENAITRAEVASIFYRLLKDEVRDENTTDVSEFSDVSASDWYGTTVATLSAMDIVRGYEDGTFRPNAPITRAEFAAIATRFFEETGAEYEPGTFEDVTGDEWFANAIADAVELGLIGGYPDGTVRPNNNITRAEACAVVNRTLGRIPHVDHLLPADEMTTWPDNNPSDWFYADMQEATNGHEYEWTKEDGQKVEEWTEILDKDWEDR